MKKVVILIIISFAFGLTKGAENDSLSNQRLYDIYYNQPFSYFFFGSGVGNMYPIVFESQLATTLEFSFTKKSPLVFVCSPAIMVRMLNQKSVPVRTPSYQPEASIYYRFYDKERKYNYSAFVRYCHHSNGQENNFINPDDSYNLKDANFSNNAFDFGLLVSHQTEMFLGILSGSVSHIFQQEPEIQGLYGTDFVKGHFALFLFNKSGVFDRLLGDELKITRKSVVAVDIKSEYCLSGINNVDYTDFKKRFTLQIDLSYRPKFWSMTSFFVRGYAGRDYYNIQFVKNRNMLLFGVKADLIVY